MFHRICIRRCDNIHSRLRRCHLCYIRVLLDNDKLALFENPKVEYTEMSSKCLCCITNLIQSLMEFHVQKKLIKNNNINLVAVGFAFYGQNDKS